jgi:hypothetical protein
MADCFRCVLGQLFGGYYNVPELMNSMPLGDTWSDWAHSHGFNREADSGDIGYSIRRFLTLADAWQELVKQRLDAGLTLKGEDDGTFASGGDA